MMRGITNSGAELSLSTLGGAIFWLGICGLGTDATETVCLKGLIKQIGCAGVEARRCISPIARYALKAGADFDSSRRTIY